MKIKPWMIILLILLGGGAAWALERHARSQAEAKAETAEAAVDSLKQVEASLRDQYRVDTLTLTHWRTRWDSIVGPGRTDTLTIERVIAVADTTIRACTAALTTCEQRVAVATERADSAESAAHQWKKLARGPFFRPALELTVETGSWTPQGAAELTLGRSHLKALGRVEIGEGGSDCQYVSAQEATVCSTSVTTTARVGLRYSF